MEWNSPESQLGRWILSEPERMRQEWANVYWRSFEPGLQRGKAVEAAEMLRLSPPKGYGGKYDQLV